MLLDISGSYWRLQPEVKHLKEEPVGAQNKEHTQAGEEQEELVLLLCSEVIGPTNPKYSRCISINSPKGNGKCQHNRGQKNAASTTSNVEPSAMGRVSGDPPINLSRTMLCLSRPFSMSCCSCNTAHSLVCPQLPHSSLWHGGSQWTEENSLTPSAMSN